MFLLGIKGSIRVRMTWSASCAATRWGGGLPSYTHVSPDRADPWEARARPQQLLSTFNAALCTQPAWQSDIEFFCLAMVDLCTLVCCNLGDVVPLSAQLSGLTV